MSRANGCIKALLTPLLAVLLCNSIAAETTAAGIGDDLTREQLADLLREWTIAQSPFDTTIEVLTLHSVPLNGPPPERSNWFLHERIHLFFDGSTIWQEMWSKSPVDLTVGADEEPPRPQVHHTFTGWNGQFGYLRKEGEPVLSISGQIGAGDIHQLAHVF